ncbi:MAG: ribonuclease III [Bdellovibrionales bacterium]|nr:ribonuclease III [Bdellovibrionales bacterium]
MSMKTFVCSLWQRRKRYSSDLSLESRIAYSFKNQNLKVRALTHKSLAGEKRNNFHNERLEFLGDAVFDLCVSDLLMEEYPSADEGELSKMRASLVNTQDLADLALFLGLDKDLKLSAAEERDRGQLKPRLLACVLEALVGAVYLDGGYKQAKKLVIRLVGEAIKTGPVNKDYKSLLQEFIQKKFQKVPTYSTVEIKGPQHDKVFVMEVQMDQEVLGQGRGSSKKQATQEAALAALNKLGKAPVPQSQN